MKKTLIENIGLVLAVFILVSVVAIFGNPQQTKSGWWNYLNQDQVHQQG